MKKIIPFLFLSIFTTSLFSQKIVDITLQESLTQEELAGLFFGFAIANGIEAYKVLYETPDTDGTIDTASGLLVIPIRGTTRDELLPMLAYQHGTASSKTSIPSNIENFERRLVYYFAGQGYYATAADYLGLGDSKRVIHPYLHADTEASAGYDLVRAARTYFDEEGYPYNEQLFITGYSQGGHAGMAMHKALQTEPIEDLTVTAGSHMSGPYNMSGEILAATMSEVPYLFPSYAVWIIVAYQSAYGNIYDQPEEVFKEAYLTEIKGFLQGSITRGELNGLLVNKLEKESGASIVSNLFTDSFIADFQTNSGNPLRIALLDNDLFNWVPEVPTRMMYCMADDQVVFTNSIFTDSVMNANGAMDVAAIDVNTTADHGGCVIPAVFATIQFFEQYARRDLFLSTKNIAQELAFSVTPNPATDYIRLNFSQLDNNFQDYQIQLINLNGQVIQRVSTNNLQNITLPLNDVSSGLYLLHVQSENGFWAEKIMVK